MVTAQCRKGGAAILCGMAALQSLYEVQHRPLEQLSETARRLYAYIDQDPIEKQYPGFAPSNA